MIFTLNELSPWLHDLILTIITGVVIILTIFTPKYLEEQGKISKFAARKIIHSFSGLAILITPFLYYPIIAGFLGLFMTIITRTSGRKGPTKFQRELFNAIKEDEEKVVGYLQGPYAYCLAVTVVVFAFLPFSDRYYYPLASVLFRTKLRRKVR